MEKSKETIEYLVKTYFYLVEFVFNTKIAECECKHKFKDDLISDGCNALYKAAKNFNEGLGYSFTTYACESIRRNMIRRLGRRLNTEKHNISLESTAVKESINELGRHPIYLVDVVEDERVDLYKNLLKEYDEQFVKNLLEKYKKENELTYKMLILCMSGLTITEIAKEVNRTRQYVSAVFKRIGLKYKRKYIG